MARLVRKGAAAGDLTIGQKWQLLYGMTPHGAQGFDDGGAMRRAWFEHRERLMSGLRLFQRPDAFWEFEAPARPAYREADVTALVRMGLLTPEERAHLIAQPPPRLPEVFIEDSGEHWTIECRHVETVCDWHQRENRTDQANAWRAAAAQLRAMLAKEDL